MMLKGLIKHFWPPARRERAAAELRQQIQAAERRSGRVAEWQSEAMSFATRAQRPLCHSATEPVWECGICGGDAVGVRSELWVEDGRSVQRIVDLCPQCLAVARELEEWWISGQ